MTRRPFIVVCPKTGRAAIRTHQFEVTGSYFFVDLAGRWFAYHKDTPINQFFYSDERSAAEALKSAPPPPADAVWGPEDEPKAKMSPGPTLIASLRDIRIRLENGTIDALPQTIVVDVGDGRMMRYYKEGEPPNA